MQRSPSSSRFVMFPAVPNVDGYTAVGSVAASCQRLTEVIRGGEGVGLVVGPTGTGKSLLCCLLAEALREEFHVVLLADSQLNNGETLLQHILFHLNLPYRDLSEGELRLALIDHLTQGMRGSAKSALALIIDEAQGLSPKLLEEVRMITNIVRDGEPRVRTILAGHPGLEERLQDPALDSLQQRIASRCYLHPLSREEAAHYLRDALARGTADAARTIDDEAVRLVHQATGGIPRLLNQFMRQTLSLAGSGRLDATLIDRVWQTMQQLPSPVTDADVAGKLGAAAVDAEGIAGKTPPELAPATSIVEFGLLTPEDDPRQAEPEPPAVAGWPAAPAVPETIETPLAEPTAGAESERIDPIAQADPQLAADLERMTESLQQLAGDHSPEPMWVEESESARALDDELNLADWPTREWVVPPVAEAAAPVLSIAELFGDDFEDEETIPAERNYGSGEPGGADDSQAAADAAAPLGLERSLHEQLIGLARETTEPSQAEPSPVDSSQVELSQAEPSQVEPLTRVATTGRAETSAQEPHDIQLADDSDLLVIEEAIEVEPLRIQAPLFDDDASDSRDYEALFNRLRQGE